MDKDIVEGVKWVISVECDHVLIFFMVKKIRAVASNANPKPAVAARKHL